MTTIAHPRVSTQLREVRSRRLANAGVAQVPGRALILAFAAGAARPVGSISPDKTRRVPIEVQAPSAIAHFPAVA